MMHFEEYRWEDHVPRRGSWKFSLVAGALAFGVLAAALVEPSDGRWAAAPHSGHPASGAIVAGLDIPRPEVTASLFGVMDQQIHCLNGTRSAPVASEQVLVGINGISQRS